MPLPKPEPDEEHDDFIDRCMGDDQTNEDFPDPGQRRAVCETQWEEGQEGATAMKYPRILQAITTTPWAILPESLEMILGIFSAAATGRGMTAEEIDARIGATHRPSQQRDGAIAVLPLHGPIAQRMNLMTQVSGGTSTEIFGNQLRAAVAEPGIKAIVIDVDSPGGTVHGVPELAAEMLALRGRKPIVAVANSLMASAAYWLGAMADEVVVTPSAVVGSIGVVAPHIDTSKRDEKEGVKVTLISAGKHKGEGMEGAITDDTRAEMQALVDNFYDLMVRGIAKGRGVVASVVRNGYGEGQVVSAKKAVELGMADRVGTLRETLRRLGASPQALMAPNVAGATGVQSRSSNNLDGTIGENDDDGPSIDTRKRRLRLLEKASTTDTARPAINSSDETALAG